jgi:hypothetical protein
MNKNKKVLDNFVFYCQCHPDERFWQALRNWAGVNFIFIGQFLTTGVQDTFYWEGKDK